jgi:cytochrome c551/c552
MKKNICIAYFIAFSSILTAQTPEIKAILKQNNCATCHKLKGKFIAPSWTMIAEKGYSVAQFSALVAVPVPSNWPKYKAMVGLPDVPKEDLEKIATWVNELKIKN